MNKLLCWLTSVHGTTDEFEQSSGFEVVGVLWEADGSIPIVLRRTSRNYEVSFLEVALLLHRNENDIEPWLGTTLMFSYLIVGRRITVTKIPIRGE